MTTSESQNHWKDVAKSLGIEIAEEPAAEIADDATAAGASVTSTKQNESLAELVETSGRAVDAEPVVESEPSTANTQPIPEAPRRAASSWTDIASQLGVEVPPEPEEDTSDSKAAEARRIDVEEVVEETVAATYVEVEKPSMFADAAEGHAVPAFSFIEDLVTEKSGEFVAEALEAAQAIERVLDAGEIESEEESTDAEAVSTEESGERRRRRRRRRGRSRRGAERHDSTERERERDNAAALSEVHDSRPAMDDATERERDEAPADDDEPSEEGEHDQTGDAGAPHRKIPAWKEAVSTMIESNIKAHEKSASSRGDRRGRGRRN